MDNCVVLDIETPNGRANSICAIAVLDIKKGEIVIFVD